MHKCNDGTLRGRGGQKEVCDSVRDDLKAVIKMESAFRQTSEVIIYHSARNVLGKGLRLEVLVAWRHRGRPPGFGCRGNEIQCRSASLTESRLW